MNCVLVYLFTYCIICEVIDQEIYINRIYSEVFENKLKFYISRRDMMICKVLSFCLFFIITIHPLPSEKQKLKQPVVKLSDQVRLIIDHYKNPNPEGLPGVKIPEPVHWPDKKLSRFGVTLNLHDTHVYGFSKLQIVAIDMDFSKLEIYMAVQANKLEVLGNYTLTTLLGLSRTQGSCNITCNEVYMEGIANLFIDKKGHLLAQEIELDVSINNFVVDFKRTDFFERILNSMGPFVIDTMKPFLMWIVNKYIRVDVNKKLKSLKQTFPNSIEPIDLAIAKGRKFVRELGYDPYRIPDISHGSWLFQATVNDIWITGLSSFYRTGNVTVRMENSTVYVGFDMGGQKIEGTCKWEISVTNLLAKTGNVAFSVDYFETSVKVNQSVDIRNKPQVEQLQLKLGNIQIHMDGLGTADYIIEILINFFPNLLRNQILKTLETPLKTNVAGIIDGIDFEKIIEEHLLVLDKIVSENFTMNIPILKQQEIEKEEEIFVEEGLTIDQSHLDDEIL